MVLPLITIVAGSVSGRGGGRGNVGRCGGRRRGETTLCVHTLFRCSVWLFIFPTFHLKLLVLLLLPPLHESFDFFHPLQLALLWLS